jgi:ribosomal protein S25
MALLNVQKVLNIENFTVRNAERPSHGIFVKIISKRSGENEQSNTEVAIPVQCQTKTLEKAVKIYLTVGQSTFSSTLAAEITGGIHGSALRSLKNEHVIELVQKRGNFR